MEKRKVSSTHLGGMCVTPSLHTRSRGASSRPSTPSQSTYPNSRGLSERYFKRGTLSVAPRRMVRRATSRSNASCSVPLLPLYPTTATPRRWSQQSNGFALSKRRYVVATMSHCGSIYEEMTRQLVATGRWTHVTVKSRPSVKTLVVADTQKDISEVSVHLLLGDKPSSERIIATRRALHSHIHRPNGRPAVGRYRVRVPMGNGGDGEARMIDFVENTRCITLKSSMVATLLEYHHYDWSVLGAYLPSTYKIMPGRPNGDERMLLLNTAKQLMRGEEPPLWIAKSSSGCHGDDIEIFSGDRMGLQKLLSYVDNQREGNPWVAQRYIDRPLLYHKRKFDIRLMVLLVRDPLSVYVHEELVMRMSSRVYSKHDATSRNPDARLAHITNHCVQAASKLYSTYEEGNELWREHLDGLIRYRGERLLERLHNCSFFPNGCRPGQRGTSQGEFSGDFSHLKSPVTLGGTILPQMDRIVVDSVLAALPHIPQEPVPAPTHCFQILGYDFLIDDSLRVALLEINGAPAGPERLVPKIMEDTIELVITPHFPCTLDDRPNGSNGYRQVYPVYNT